MGADLKRIERLTPEQEARIPEFRDAWVRAGLSTERADRPRAEAGVRLAYEAAGLKPPRLFIWLDSPTAGAMGASILYGTTRAGKDVRAQVRAQVWGQVGRAICGQHDAGWLSFYDFFAEVCGLTCAARIRGLSEVAKSAGWWWPFADAVILTERPTVLHRDAEGRLHCESGAALLYPDGTRVWAWHGTRVPAQWIENRETVEPSEVLKATNVEQRAAGCAILGWPRMLSALKVKVVDDSGSDDIGQLIELTLPGLREPGRFLKAACPRNGIICEGVPRVSDIDNLPIDTALHAQAWRIGDPLSDYIHPPVRT